MRPRARWPGVDFDQTVRVQILARDALHVGRGDPREALVERAVIIERKIVVSDVEELFGLPC